MIKSWRMSHVVRLKKLYIPTEATKVFKIITVPKFKMEAEKTADVLHALKQIHDLSQSADEQAVMETSAGSDDDNELKAALADLAVPGAEKPYFDRWRQLSVYSSELPMTALLKAPTHGTFKHYSSALSDSGQYQPTLVEYFRRAAEDEDEAIWFLISHDIFSQDKVIQTRYALWKEIES
jgi:hypothetical protein